MQPTNPTYLEICRGNPWALSRKETLLLAIPLFGIPAIVQVYRTNRQIAEALEAARSAPPSQPMAVRISDPNMQNVPLTPRDNSPLLGRVHPLLVQKSNRYVLAVISFVGTFLIIGLVSTIRAFKAS